MTDATKAILENRKLKMTGPLPENKMFLKAARVVEGLSKISEITVDFMSPDKALDLADVVGRTHKVKVQKGEEGANQWRDFVATCTEAEFMGVHDGYGFYTLQLRSWLWFLTRTSNNFIFQNMSTLDIIKKIFQDRGFSDYTINVSRTPDPRIYTVQYDETDYDFLCRLMEEEGIYFFSTVKNAKDHLMIVDDIGAHVPVAEFAEIKFALRETGSGKGGGGQAAGGFRKTQDHIFEWRGNEAQTPGKVTLRDYNFEKPKADMTTAKVLKRGTHPHASYERYSYSGRYRETALGEIYARVKMEAEAAKYQTRRAVGNVRTMTTGATFKLKKHMREEENQEYLVISGVHMMQIENENKDETQDVEELPGSIKFDEKNRDAYRCTFEIIPKSTPYRAPLKTQWPKIPGILLAKVTGPSGEEIYTDKYGRIKVQFPWDREGKNDENTTCWVRVVTPWSGKNWGMVAVPRIGQEVVIQFEDGDPDRPICTGMLYNADVMPPYALPANMTQSGILTRSTKGGSDKTYNELVFEDKAGEEFVRLHAQKHFFHAVENQANISVGYETQQVTSGTDKSVTTKIYQNRTETIEKGDLTVTVQTGNEKRDIKTDREEKVGGNAKQEVTGNKETKVTGNTKAETTGSYTEKVTGSSTTTVTGGVTIESMQSIELKVGANSIKIDQSGITIKGIMIKTDAGGMATHKAGGMMMIQGSLVLIN